MSKISIHNGSAPIGSTNYYYQGYPELGYKAAMQVVEQTCLEARRQLVEAAARWTKDLFPPQVNVSKENFRQYYSGLRTIYRTTGHLPL